MVKNNEKRGFLNNFFKLKENGTTVKTEVIAGITTFITMAYIIFVNPSILMQAGMNAKGLLGTQAVKAGLSIANDPVIGAVFVATILSSVAATLVMGLFANVPFALSAGMGMNAFFTFYVVLTLHYSWQAALSLALISGIINIIITATKLRILIIKAIPQSLRSAIGAGIGLFIAIIGMENGGIVTKSSDTLITLGNFKDPGVILTVIGIAIIAILMSRGVKGAILIGIIATTIIGIPMGITNISNLKTIVQMPPSLAPTFMKLDFAGLLKPGTDGNIISILTGLITVILAFSLADMFDAIGTLIGTGTKTGIFKEDDFEKSNGGFKTKFERALFADAIGTTLGSFLGTSTITTYVESASGISEGGKTGLTSTVVAILFLVSLFFAPIIGIVPSQATAPALIIVGALMIGSVTKVNFEDFSEAFPAFMTIAFMPFTYSISNGIAAGFIFYPITKIVVGKAKEVHPLMYIIGLLFLLRFAFFMG